MKNLLIISCLSLFLSVGVFAQTSNSFVKTSKDFLMLLKAGENTDKIVDEICNFSQEALEKGLVSDEEKLAFWLNIYNGFIQRILKERPELYEDRGSFFKEKFVSIAGRQLAFADIEHGIIRHSQYEYALGYITNPFAPSYERNLRVDNREWRIHFALNCGAKSCPPVAIYDNTKLDAQLDKSTQMYLDKFSEYKSDENAVYATSLFSWFRGDFGGKRGTKKKLVKYGIAQNTDFDLKFASYDWTLDLDNYIEL